MEFKHHNIALADGTFTLGPHLPAFEASGLCRSIVGAVRDTFESRHAATVRVADLGALEGGYAVALARGGFDVVAIEGRATNIAKCRFVEERVGLPNLRFVHDDVRNLERYGRFDAVLCAGLLYHVDRPVAFLRRIERCTRELLVLETHVATERPPDGIDLGGWTTHEGRRGRWFAEWDPGTPPASIDANVRASLGNYRSFWLAGDELVEALRSAGFRDIAEQRLEPPDADTPDRRTRVLLVANTAGAGRSSGSS